MMMNRTEKKNTKISKADKVYNAIKKDTRRTALDQQSKTPPKPRTFKKEIL